MKHFLAAFAVITLVVGLGAAQDAKNELYQELTTKGLAIPGGPTVKLPLPICTPGKVPDNANQVLDKAAGRIPTDLFIRNSVNAPISMAIEQVEGNKKDTRCAQKIDMTFLAYGTLDAVAKTDFIRDLLSPQKKGKKNAQQNQGVELSAAELSKRGIRLTEAPDRKEMFETFTMSVLDKVEVTGITRTVQTRSKVSVLYAMTLDDRFAKDKEYPNQWRRLKEEQAEGPAEPYSGLAGYMLVTALPEPKGALLVEMHMLMHEPPAWFGERDLLRAKLPTVLRDNAHQFRAKVKAAK